jgi:hypothetical protein
LRQIAKALNMIVTFQILSKERFFGGTIINALYANGPIRSGIDPTLAI